MGASLDLFVDWRKKTVSEFMNIHPVVSCGQRSGWPEKRSSRCSAELRSNGIKPYEFPRMHLIPAVLLRTLRSVMHKCIVWACIGFEVLEVGNSKLTVFLNVTTCSLVGRYFV